MTSTIQHSLKSLEQQSQKERDSVTACGLQNQELHSLLSTSSENISACLQERYCNGIAGVPITFLDKYNPEQFEIVNANDYRKTENVPVKPHGLIKDKDASITLSESKKEMQKSIDKKDSKNIIAKSRAEQSRAEQSRDGLPTHESASGRSYELLSPGSDGWHIAGKRKYARIFVRQVL